MSVLKVYFNIKMHLHTYIYMYIYNFLLQLIVCILHITAWISISQSDHCCQCRISPPGMFTAWRQARVR